jgi:hypothetical protein
VIRVVVAVGVLAALLAVSLPAVESARVAQSDGRVGSMVDRLESAAGTLAARNDAVGSGVAGARRVCTLHLPIATWGTAGLERLSIRRLDGGNTTRVTWRVAGGDPHARLLEGPSIRPPADGLLLRSGGRVRLALRLVSHGNDRVVRLRRVDGRADGRDTASGTPA